MWSPGELLESVGWVILGFGVAFVIDWGAKDRQQTYYAFGLEKSRSARALQLTARSRAVNFRFRHVVLLALVIHARYWYVEALGRSGFVGPEHFKLAVLFVLALVWALLNMLDGRREVDALLAAEPPSEES